MTSCEQIRRGIEAEGLSTAAARHLAGCADCQLWIETWGDGQTPPPSDLRHAFGALSGELAKRRGLRHRLAELPSRVRTVLAMAAGLGVGTVGLALLRGDFSSYPALRMALTLLVFAGVGVVAALVCLRSFAKVPAPSWLEGTLFTGGVLAPVVAAAIPIEHHHPLAWADAGAAFWPRAVACLGFGLALAVPLALLLWLLERGQLVDRRRLALAAITSSLAANLALQLHCPLVSTTHLIAGHASIIVLLLPALWGWRRLRRGPLDQARQSV